MSLRGTWRVFVFMNMAAAPHVVQALEVSEVGSCLQKRYSELESEAQKEGGDAVYWFLYGAQSAVISNKGQILFKKLNAQAKDLPGLQTQCFDHFSANTCESVRKVKGCFEDFRSQLQRSNDDCLRLVTEWNQNNPNDIRDSKIYCQKEMARLDLYLSEEHGGLISCTQPAYSCGSSVSQFSYATSNSSNDNRLTFTSSAMVAPEGRETTTKQMIEAPLFSPWAIANSGSRSLRITFITEHNITRSERGGTPSSALPTDLNKLPGGLNYQAPEAKATCRLTRSEIISREHQVVVAGQTLFAHNLPSFEGLNTLHLAGVQYLDAANDKNKNIVIRPGYNAVLPHAKASEREKDPPRKVRLIILCGGYKKVSIGGSLGAKIPTGNTTYASQNEVTCDEMPKKSGGTDPKYRYAVVSIEAHGTIFTSGNSLQLSGVPENNKELGLTCSSRVVLVGSGQVYKEFLSGL